jgi:hypothetical protein
MERLSISSFLQNGHAYHLYVYEEVGDVPKGTVLKDANEIISSERIFKYIHHDSYAGFANLFRYKLLLEKGGFWVDTDVVCLRPFHFEFDYVFASTQSLRRPLDLIKKRHHISNWFIKAPIDSEIMNYCYSEAAKRNPEELVWGETGPRLLSKAVYKYGMQEYIAPHGTFFPTSSWQWRLLIIDSFIIAWKWRKARKSAYAVHLYNELWRRKNIDKNDSFPRNSVYEQLKRRFLDSA